MDSLDAGFLLAELIAIFSLPRRWAILPLLISACYMPTGPGLYLGPFSFTILRLLIIAGSIRIILKQEYTGYRLVTLDTWILIWALWAILASILHRDMTSVLINRLGMVYNVLGIYFYIRIACRSIKDVRRIYSMTAILLIPVAAEMVLEQSTGENLFHFLGGVPEFSEIRAGRIRAQGPFSHPILAGTVGAVSLPLMVGLWQYGRFTALAGILATLAMILTSASSGPIVSGFMGIIGLMLWYWRDRIKLIPRLAVVSYIALDILMQAPAYYLISYIDLTGGSTGWHRAALIDAALEHIDEWWLAGTDYTRHWLPYGVSWSEDHVDITNYFLRMGVDGGLPLMLLFAMTLWQGFKGMGMNISKVVPENGPSTFLIWTLGVSLATHCISFMSVAYFDQSVVFLYSTLASIACLSLSSPAETLTTKYPGYYRYKPDGTLAHNQSKGVL